MGREAMERLTKNVIDRERQAGREISVDKAQRYAADVARKADRKAIEAGKSGERGGERK